MVERLLVMAIVSAMALVLVTGIYSAMAQTADIQMNIYTLMEVQK